MGEFRIRPARPEDVDSIRRVMIESAAVLSAGFYSDQEAADAATYLTIPDPDIIADGTYFVAESSEAVVGCGGWSMRKKLFTGSAGQEAISAERLDPAIDPARIRAFFVLPDYARQGVASAIYRECESAARGKGFRRLELMATLPGVPLYDRLGFIAGERVAIDLPNGRSLPGVRMAKHLA